jgi:N6-L-threonylcarbamoyladenine synthase
MREYTILGIETSCDETAAAIYSSAGLRSNSLFSQIYIHQRYGGVIPELAARSHIEKINIIVEQALSQAACSISELDVVGVTNRPGLPGSLLIGLSFAKGLAWAAGKKIIGINHLEGHIFSSFLEHKIPFPHLCLTASGGHTALYLVHDFGVFDLVAQTRDDAAGEAFDKIAKLIELPYPGGPVIEKLAQQMDFTDFYQYPRGQQNMLDFSFSGLKTAVLYDLVSRNLYNLQEKKFTKQIDNQIKGEVASSLLVCIKDIFINKLSLALNQHPEVKAITFVGGVACNQYLKAQLNAFCNARNIAFYTTSPKFCTDNAAMIAFVANYKAQQGKFADFSLDIFS